ncbi:hypothetical protein Lalb_Chr20g0116661 [Lupinus albus]|uniref:Uncharacterized protein n=1 Tax=Lupinus albus TaxID=3870 RepID=A0A6A4NU67_LUPAL|nr:hypothetical protein Lalb_Chr20g0116661 [Lupinus albus]
MVPMIYLITLVDALRFTLNLHMQVLFNFTISCSRSLFQLIESFIQHVNFILLAFSDKALRLIHIYLFFLILHSRKLTLHQEGTNSNFFPATNAMIPLTVSKRATGANISI